MSEGGGKIVAIALIIGLILFILYIITLIATTVLTIAAAGGSIWGGGRAILNYGRSFKENMIDSNRAVS
jgi:hypothetical protein